MAVEVKSFPVCGKCGGPVSDPKRGLIIKGQVYTADADKPACVINTEPKTKKKTDRDPRVCLCVECFLKLLNWYDCYEAVREHLDEEDEQVEYGDDADEEDGEAPTVPKVARCRQCSGRVPSTSSWQDYCSEACFNEAAEDRFKEIQEAVNDNPPVG
jgi:hypothetical protein